MSAAKTRRTLAPPAAIAAATFSFAALEAATNGFLAGNCIGSGGSGDVYRGVLNGIPIAVKRLRLPVNLTAAHARRHIERRFQAELQTLLRYRHPRVVQLLGSAIDDRPTAEYPFALVLELLEGGALADYLLPPVRPALPGGAGAAAAAAEAGLARGDRPAPLSALQRLDIALGAASGLAYLHGLREEGGESTAAPGLPAAAAGGAGGTVATATAAAEGAAPVLHRDMKSANVSTL